MLEHSRIVFKSMLPSPSILTKHNKVQLNYKQVNHYVLYLKYLKWNTLIISIRTRQVDGFQVTHDKHLGNQFILANIIKEFRGQPLSDEMVKKDICTEVAVDVERIDGILWK